MARFAPIFDLAGRTQGDVAAFALLLTTLTQAVATLRTSLHAPGTDGITARRTARCAVVANGALAPRTVHQRIVVYDVIAVRAESAGPPLQ